MELKVEVKDSTSKGRIMVATQNIAVGDLIFCEEPLIYASWHDHLCIECDLPHSSSECEVVRKFYPQSVAEQINEIIECLSNLAAIGEKDRARLFLKCLTRIESQGVASSPLLAALSSLSAVHLNKSLACMREIRGSRILWGVLNSSLTDDILARILSVLNTNSHELPTYGGSGVYLLASRMEHNCRPNCTFTPVGTTVRVYAIEPIPAGHALSIDYLSSDVYRPTSERQAKLQESYDFQCTCDACTILPDAARLFVCPRRKCKKQFAPVGAGLLPEDWKCTACGFVIGNYC
jgi:hypothetical protein